MKYFTQNLKWIALSLLLAIGSTMWADEVTDVLTKDNLGLPTSGTTYSNFSNKTSNSNAVYAGQAASNGGKCIQLRATNPAGIVTTQSGGNIKSISVTWNSNTTNERIINIYGKNSAYSSAADLYGNSKGTLIGSIKSTDNQQVIISDDYEYIGIVSNNGALYLDDITIVWEDGNSGNAGPIDPKVSFEQEIIDIEIGKTTTNSITKPNDLTVTYSIESVNGAATINSETGEVTGVKEGSATVTASWEAVEDKYNAGSKSYTLNVVPEKLTKEVTWIAQEQGYSNAQSITAFDVDNAISAVCSKGTGNTAPAYYNTGTALRLYAGNTITFSGATIMKIEFTFHSGDDGNTISVNKGIYENNTWTGSTNEIVFTIDGTKGHRRIQTITITYEAVDVAISSVGYATLYYGTTALEVPEGVKAYTYQQTEDGIAVENTYEAGDAIPAGEAVVLQGTPNMLYTFKRVTTENTASETNALHGSDVAAMTTGGDKYYALSLNQAKEENSVGFYFYNEGGAAFECPAHRAYLALKDNGNGVKSFYTFGSNEANGLNSIAAPTNAANDIYNLQGQRVAVPTRGIYIVNGKKVFIK